MSDMQQRVQEELAGKIGNKAAKRDSKVLPFVIIMVVVFGLMAAFLYYTNQNVTVGNVDQTNAQPTNK